MVIETDASLLGWGVAWQGTTTGGPLVRARTKVPHKLSGTARWGLCGQDLCKGKEEYPHSATNGQHLSSELHQSHGGTRSQGLARLALSLWDWCLRRGITLSAEHLPGVENLAADRESRLIRTTAEWKLKSEVFQELMDSAGPCRVDLFAIRLNAQLKRYISWHPEPFAMATDAFQVKWSGLMGYAFPPFALIGKCLRKLRQERSTILLIAPVWPAQPWYAGLLELFIQVPILLPIQQDLLKDPFGRNHPLMAQGQLQLAAWRLSGDNTSQRAFRRELRGSSGPVGAKALTQLTSRGG